MSMLPPNVKIDLTAVAKAWPLMMKRVGDYFAEMQKVMSRWLPAVSEAHRYEVKRMHTMYGRKRKARQKRRRKR